MKSLVIIFAVFIVGILFIVFWNYTSNAPIEHNNYNEISWRLPLDSEIKLVGDSFLHSNMDLCADYFIKKFEGAKYLIACETEDGSWTYYTAFTGQHRVFRTPRKYTLSLMPPEILAEHPANDPIETEKNSKAPTQSASSRETISR